MGADAIQERRREVICAILLITVFGLGVACGTVWSIKPDEDAEDRVGRGGAK